MIGAGIQVFEVSTLGQPFEVVKTQMAANPKQGLVLATKTIFNQGGMPAFWRGLIPWAWIEASTKGAVLLFTASEIEWATQSYFGLGKGPAGILGGMGGGVKGFLT